MKPTPRSLHDSRDLVVRLTRGDELAAEAFVAEYRDRIARVLTRRGIANADIPDVTQEVLIDAIRQLRAGAFRNDSQLFSWLYNIIRGKATDYSRRGVNRRMAAMVPIETDDVLDSVSPVVPPAQYALYAIREAIASLPVRLQTIVQLHCYENMTAADIGEHLGLSEKRIRTLLTDSKAQVRRNVLGLGKISTRYD